MRVAFAPDGTRVLLADEVGLGKTIEAAIIAGLDRVVSPRVVRLIEDDTRESNVDFRLPYEDVVTTWRACMASAYQPAKLLQRKDAAHVLHDAGEHRVLARRVGQRGRWRRGVGR